MQHAEYYCNKIHNAQQKWRSYSQLARVEKQEWCIIAHNMHHFVFVKHFKIYCQNSTQTTLVHTCRLYYIELEHIRPHPRTTHMNRFVCKCHLGSLKNVLLSPVLQYLEYLLWHEQHLRVAQSCCTGHEQTVCVSPQEKNICLA